MDGSDSQRARDQIRLALQHPGFEHWRSEFCRIPSQVLPDGRRGAAEFGDPGQVYRPEKRPDHFPGSGRVAAVLVLLTPIATSAFRDQIQAAEPSIEYFLSPFESTSASAITHPLRGVGMVLTQRPSSMSDHAGQISLPGGKQEPGESLLETAQRELEEEVGVSSHQIEVLGKLKPVYIPPSDFTMHPFVAWHEPTPSFVRSPQEVEQILMPSLDHLMAPSTLDRAFVQSGRDRSGAPRLLDVPVFRLKQHLVWGATAIVISELVTRMEASVGSLNPPDQS